MINIDIVDSGVLESSDSLFSSADWLESIQKSYDYKLQIYKVSDKNNAIAVPFFYRKKFFVKQTVMPVYLPYISFVLLKGDKVDHLFEFFFRTLEKSYFSSRFSFSVTSKIAESGLDLLLNERKTYVLDIRNETLSGYSKSKRKKTRKLLREYSLVVREEKNLDMFYTLEDKTFARKNSAPFGVRECEKDFVDQQIDIGNMSQWIFYDNETAVGAKIVINDGRQRMLYAWKGYTNPEYLDKGLSVLLTHLMIEEAKKRFDYYNFHGANLASFASFKAGFGGELKSYYEFNWTKYPRFVSFAQRIMNDCNIFRL